MRARKNIKKLCFIFTAIIVAACFAFIGCGDNDAPAEPTDEKTTYTVSFDSHGGTSFAPITYTGTAITLPVPTRTGYDFIGWFGNAELTGTAVSSPYTPVSDITLHAGWNEHGTVDPPDEPTPTPDKKIIVSFDSHGGTTYEDEEYTDAAISLPVPERYNYEFAGWFDNAELSGDPLAATYAPTASVTLHAKWIACVYIYMYYGTSTDHKRFTYHDGDTVTFSDIAFTPDPVTVDGAQCPFVKWVYEDTDDSPEGEIAIGADNIIITAVYDYSAVPPKNRLEQNADGSYTSTGNVACVLRECAEGTYAYSATVTFSKSMSGAAGIAFRMNMSGNDYAFEDKGTTYLAAGIHASTGKLQVCSVTDGNFAQLAGSQVAFEDLPASFREKYEKGINVCVELAVVDYGTRLEVYIDRELAYTFSDAAKLAAYTGTGLGIRSSAKGAEFEDIFSHGELTVSFDSNGGTAADPVEYTYGKLDLPRPTKDGVALGGWYYDKELTNKVVVAKFRAEGDITLYAKWVTDYYTVTLDSNGGTEYAPLPYAEGTIDLPSPQKVNGIFTGWYYDELLTRAVNANEPDITSDTTLYAAYRLPYGNVTDNGDGSYTTTANTAAVIGTDASRTFDITMNITFAKGGGGAIGMLFCGAISADYSFEKGAAYLSAQIVPSTGNLQVCKINNGFAHVPGTPVALASLPQSWQTKFNDAAANDGITVELKLECRTGGFRVYIDGALAYSCTDAALVAGYTGDGYGIRSSAKGVTFDYDYREVKTEQATLTFVYNDATVATVETETSGIFVIPDMNKTLANGNVLTYTGGWYDGQTKLDAGYTVTSSKTIEGRFTEKVTRNGVEIVTDGGETSYIATGTRASMQGFTVPDVQMESGTYSYTLTLAKPATSKTFEVRTLFFVDDANSVNITGTGNQAVPFVNFNSATGGVMVGKKIKNSSVSFFTCTFATIKACAYKTYFESVAAGNELVLDFKIVFDKGWFKFYINDCLIIVYGDADHTGETVYGATFTKSSKTNGNTGADAALAEFDAYINAPTGLAVGIQMWQDTANAGGRVTFSNVSCVPLQPVTQNADPALTAQTAYIKTKETL